MVPDAWHQDSGRKVLGSAEDDCDPLIGAFGKEGGGPANLRSVDHDERQIFKWSGINNLPFSLMDELSVFDTQKSGGGDGNRPLYHDFMVKPVLDFCG
jgi:hypothetical protein